MEELTQEQALAIFDGKPAEVAEEKPVEAPAPEALKPESETAEIAEQEVDPAPEAEEKPAPAVDFTAKVKFKANGQEVERSIQELINDAQLASNYNRRMQELAAQEKAFQLAQIPVQVDPMKEYQDLDRQISEKAMKKLGINNPDEFFPDASINRVHFAVYQQALQEINAEKQQANYAVQQDRQIEEQYMATLTSEAKDPAFQDINAFAEKALFELPQQGKIAEFQQIYGTYQKLKQRDALYLAGQDYRTVKLTADDVKTITQFYNEQKVAYSAKRGKDASKEAVKAAVPVGVKIKPTVKVESTSDNSPTPKPKIDFKKMRGLSLDEVAKQL